MTTKRNVAAVVAQDEAQTGQEAAGLPAALAELRKALDGVEGHATRLQQAREAVEAAERDVAELREQRDAAYDKGAPTIAVTRAIREAEHEVADLSAAADRLGRAEVMAKLHEVVRAAASRVEEAARPDVEHKVKEIEQRFAEARDVLLQVVRDAAALRNATAFLKVSPVQWQDLSRTRVPAHLGVNNPLDYTQAPGVDQWSDQPVPPLVVPEFVEAVELVAQAHAIAAPGPRTGMFSIPPQPSRRPQPQAGQEPAEKPLFDGTAWHLPGTPAHAALKASGKAVQPPKESPQAEMRRHENELARLREANGGELSHEEEDGFATVRRLEAERAARAAAE